MRSPRRGRMMIYEMGTEDRPLTRPIKRGQAVCRPSPFPAGNAREGGSGGADPFDDDSRGARVRERWPSAAMGR